MGDTNGTAQVGLPGVQNRAFWLQVGVLLAATALLYYPVWPDFPRTGGMTPNHLTVHLFLYSRFLSSGTRKSGGGSCRSSPRSWDCPSSWERSGFSSLGSWGVEFFLSRTSFIFLLAGLIVYFLGWNYFKAFLFPWAFLF